MTTLNRIEPDRRSRDVRPGARVPVADPAWTLSRQWWTGELDGSDGGAPLFARFRLAQSAIGQGNTATNDVTPSASLADDVLADARADGDGDSDWRTAFQIGREIVAALKVQEAAIARVIEQQGDPSGNLGEVLEALIRRRGELPEAFPLEGAHPALRRVAKEDRLDGLAMLRAFNAGDRQAADVDEASGGRLSHLVSGLRREHAFDLVSGTHRSDIAMDNGGIALARAPGPAVHWSDLDLTNTDPVDPDEQVEAMLSRLSFAGSPPPNWWNFEEAALQWHAAPAGPSDLGQLLLAAGVTNQREVMWIAPFDCNANSIAHIAKVEVVDAFGEAIDAVESDESFAGSWKVKGGASSIAILSEGTLLRGGLIEQVALGTDELDNLLWAEERIVRGDLGRGTRSASPREPRDVDAPSLALRVSPPTNWYPYVLGESKLEVAPLKSGEHALPPTTVLLPAKIEASPAAFGTGGVAVERRWVLARSPSGARISWTVRTRSLATLQGSSGLGHDVVLKPSA